MAAVMVVVVVVAVAVAVMVVVVRTRAWPAERRLRQREAALLGALPSPSLLSFRLLLLSLPRFLHYSPALRLR
jgi:NADH:ubiquinone oxidoreductase subunit 6 (subunit J)